MNITLKMLAIAAMGCLALNLAAAGATEATPEPLRIAGAPAMGDDRAPVTLIEYSDYQCPYCARHYRETLPSIAGNYIDTGNVKLVMRQFPIPNLHLRSAAAALAALCAEEQGKYWEMHDILFNNQKKMFDADLLGYAADLGLDAQSFSDCLAEEKYAGQIEKDIEEGNRMGVRGTPSFILGLTDPADPDTVRTAKLIYGARNYEYFARAIEELLAEEMTSAAEASPRD